MNNYIYGIDFGTTNSSLAILDIKRKKIIKIFTVPSLIFFPNKQNDKRFLKYFIGQEAINEYVNSNMDGRFLKSIKRILPKKKFTKARILTKSYSPEELVALIIKELKQKADNFLNRTVETTIIGRPVFFDKNQENDKCAQDRLSKAAEIAGFKEYYFQMEPIGAAYTYEQNIKEKELVLVADFGGGTSDFSLMYLKPTSLGVFDRRKDMLSRGGIYIGGDNFDSDIMWHVGTPNFGRGVKEQIADKWLDLPLSYFTNICTWEKMNFLNSIRMKNAIRKSYVFSGKNPKVKNLKTLIEKNLGYMFFKEIEKTKIALTENDITYLTFDSHDIKITEKVTISEFEFMTSKNVKKISDYLDDFIYTNNLLVEEIDTIFLTGGTSQVRPIRNIFFDRFSKSKIKSGDNFNSVAMGLAYSYFSL